MKAILAIIFLFNIQVTYSQTELEDDKPSWGTSLPTREAAPDLEFGDDLEDENEIDRNDFGMDRSSLLEPDQTEIITNDSMNLERPVVNSAEEIAKIDNDQKEQENIEAQQKKEEDERIAAEQLKEQEAKTEEDRIAVEQAKEQEKKAADEKIAAEQLREQQRLIEEKRIADQIANENVKPIEPIQNEVVTTENDAEEKLSEVVVTAPILQAYKWKKTKNALPVYPTKAAREKKEGWVEVKVTISGTGDVADAVVVGSSRNYRVFNNAAVKAVKQWKFEPPSDYGIENELSKEVRIVFQL